MTSIHHDLDLLSRFGGSVTVASRHGSLASTDWHAAWRTPRHTFTRFVDLVLGWHERARQRRALLSLNDHMLRDIGLHRDAALVEGQKPFWRP